MLEWFASIETVELKCLIAGLWLVLVGIVAMIVDRFTPKGSELVRKVVHIGAGHIILLAWWMNMPTWVGVVAGILCSGISILSYIYPLFPAVQNVGRRTWGTCFYAMSVGILVALFWPIEQYQYAVLGILIMCWGDGLAGLVGREWGRHRYELWGLQKSLEGSVTMAIVSAIVTLAVLVPLGYGWQAGVCAGVVGVCAAGLETWSQLGVDNLTVPVGTAAIAYGLMQMI